MSRPFAPAGQATTVNVSASTTSGRVKFDNIAGTGLKSQNVRIFNSAAVVAFVELGDVTVTAALATGIPIAPNAAVILNAQGATHMAVILPSSTGTVYATPGEGGH